MKTTEFLLAVLIVASTMLIIVNNERHYASNQGQLLSIHDHINSEFKLLKEELDVLHLENTN